MNRRKLKAMGTEFINQAGLKRVEIYEYQREIYTGEGEFSLKRGAYKYGMAFISISSKTDGFNTFAYLSKEQLEVIRDQIDRLLEGGHGIPIDGWFDEGYGTGAGGPGDVDSEGNPKGAY